MMDKLQLRDFWVLQARIAREIAVICTSWQRQSIRFPKVGEKQKKTSEKVCKKEPFWLEHRWTKTIL